MNAPNTAIAIYAARRARLLHAMGEGVAVVPTSPERIRNRDSHYPYRHDSYFYYLTGFTEPEAALVLVGGTTPRALLFCRERNVEREIWDGHRHGPEGARASASTRHTRSPRSTSSSPPCWRTSRHCSRRSAATRNGTRAPCAG
jgi:Xaa-Pro aminopeptidase